MLAQALEEFHWGDLFNLHLDLQYLRHRFIQSINGKISSQNLTSIETLDQLARVDELLKAACDDLNEAKSVLFDSCYDGE